VGTGIQLIGHVTWEARMAIMNAEKVLYLVVEGAVKEWIKELNPKAESLFSSYGEGRPRIDTYLEMTERILQYVRQGLQVCVVFYGHPGVFVFPSHEAIRIARREGYDARMLPGISAEDCMFADLGIDPGRGGCQSFEATDFIAFNRKFDPRSHLILWQVGLIGDLEYKRNGYDRHGLHVLTEVLREYYASDHEVVVYEASPYLICKPTIIPVELSSLPEARITPISSLYVPPSGESRPDNDRLIRLGIDGTKLHVVKPCWEIGDKRHLVADNVS